MLFKIFWDFVEKMVVTSDVIEDTIRFFFMFSSIKDNNHASLHKKT